MIKKIEYIKIKKYWTLSVQGIRQYLTFVDFNILVGIYYNFYNNVWAELLRFRVLFYLYQKIIFA